MVIFGLRPTQRAVILIDGPSFYATAKALGFEADFRTLRNEVEEACDLRSIQYFTALSNDPDAHSPVRPLVDWLGFNGYRVITKTLREFTDSTGRRRVKGNIAVEIATEMVEAAGNVDHIVLISGDGDLAYAVEAAQRKGAKVTVVSSLVAGSVSDDLRRVADRFIELDDVKHEIMRREIAPAPQGEAAVGERRPAMAVVVEHRPLGRSGAVPAERRTLNLSR